MTTSQARQTAALRLAKHLHAQGAFEAHRRWRIVVWTAVEDESCGSAITPLDGDHPVDDDHVDLLLGQAPEAMVDRSHADRGYAGAILFAERTGWSMMVALRESTAQMSESELDVFRKTVQAVEREQKEDDSES